MTAKVYPIKLATVVQCDYSHNVLNTRFGEKIDTAILSFVIVDGEDIVIFDTGHKIEGGILDEGEGGQELNIDGIAADNFKKKFDELGLDFNDVNHVIISHLHWDHIQNCDLFPNAKFYIQRAEMAYATCPIYPLFYEIDEIINLLDNYRDRIIYLDGDEQITESVKAVLFGGHTVGSQGAYIKTSKDTVILTGDVCNVYENLEIRSVKEMNVVDWVKAIKRIKEEGTIILPQHEPRVVEDYPIIE